MSKTTRIGINAQRQKDLLRKVNRERRVERWKAFSRLGRSAVVSLLILTVLGTAAWGSLSYWHKRGGGVLRGIECRGEIHCQSDEWMIALEMERGVPLETVDLEEVARFLEGRLNSKVDVSRDLAEGVLVVEARAQPLLARFKKGDEWWVLRSGGTTEPYDRVGAELPLLDVNGPVDWIRIAHFLNVLQNREDLWRDLSFLQIDEGGREGKMWLLSAHHKLMLPLDEKGIAGMERYRKFLRHRPEIRSGKTIDLRFEGFAYVSAT